MRRHTGSGLRRLLALLAAAAAAALLPAAAAAPTAKPKLSDKTLYQILYVEPNHYLQSLGNVSPGSSRMHKRCLLHLAQNSHTFLARPRLHAPLLLRLAPRPCR